MKLSTQQIRGGIGTLVAPLLLAAAAAGCGGGSDGTPQTATLPPLPAPPRGNVHVLVTDTSQQPIAGATVELENCSRIVPVQTDSSGVARYENIQACVMPPNQTVQPFRVSARKSDYFSPLSRDVQLVANGQQDVTLVLQHASFAAVGLLEARTLALLDGGRNLLVELRVAVVGSDSRIFPGLTEANFSMPGLECWWGDCGVFHANGETNHDGFSRDLRPETNSFGRTSGAAPTSYAAGLLLDESLATASGIDQGRAGAKRFFDQVATPNSVAFAVSRGENSGSPILQVLGNYSSNGASFGTLVDGLPAAGTGGSLFVPALAAMADYAAANAPLAERRSAVAVTSGGWEYGCATPRSPSCAALIDAVGKARGAGVDVITIGTGYQAVEIAMRTGGAALFRHTPAQLGTIFGALDAVLARSLDHYTMRFVVDLEGEVAAPGTMVLRLLQVRINESIYLGVPLVLQVP